MERALYLFLPLSFYPFSATTFGVLVVWYTDVCLFDTFKVRCCIAIIASILSARVAMLCDRIILTTTQDLGKRGNGGGGFQAYDKRVFADKHVHLQVWCLYVAAICVR